jgi:hypothetical protein
MGRGYYVCAPKPGEKKVGKSIFGFPWSLFGHRATGSLGVALVNVSQKIFPADHGNRVHPAVIFDPGSWANKLVLALDLASWIYKMIYGKVTIVSYWGLIDNFYAHGTPRAWCCW